MYYMKVQLEPTQKPGYIIEDLFQVNIYDLVTPTVSPIFYHIGSGTST